jgi:hypothetical protein
MCMAPCCAGIFGEVDNTPSCSHAVVRRCPVSVGFGGWALPFGQPALCAARTKPVVLAVAGNDQERRKMSEIFQGRTLSRAARS